MGIKIQRIKKSITLLSFLFIGQLIYGQEIDKCREIVEVTIESINTKSSEELNQYLSDDFEVAGQKGQIAKMILQQLFMQLDEKVISHTETSQDIKNKILNIKCDIEYKGMGVKEATFVFNESNLLIELILFEMEVKTMERESKVDLIDKDVIEIPFTMLGNLIAVNVVLNGKQRTFILDNGSPKVILNSKYLAKEDKNQKVISSSKGVNGNISGMNIEKIDQLDFNGIQLNNQEVITMDLAHLEGELESKIYGLIGYELIKDYDVLFDYQKKKITLVKPDFFLEYKRLHLNNKSIIRSSIVLENHIPVVELKIGKHDLSFGIDCGAEVNLIDDGLYNQLLKETRRETKETLIGADNKSTVVVKSKIKRTKIGSKKFKNSNTVFSDIDHLNAGYNMHIDGLIGYEILSKQQTLISFSRKEVLFIE